MGLHYICIGINQEDLLCASFSIVENQIVNKMRFRLILEVNKQAFGNFLPLNYQYEQSAVIYKILHSADKEFAHWLHENGYQAAGKNFKLFTYSRFKIDKRIVLADKQRIQILSDTVEWQISFLPEKSTQSFIEGLFKRQTFEIGDKKSAVQFAVRSVEVLPPPIYSEEMTFATLSPLCVKFRNDRGGIDYLAPTDVRAEYLLIKGLQDRYRSAYQKEIPCCALKECKLEVLNQPKSVLVTIKTDTPQQTRVRGYITQFKLKAPAELLQLMYETGAGNLCSQGFGCLRVLDQNSLKQSKP